MFAQLNISLLKEFLEGLSQMDFGNCLMICGERFDNEWMNCSLSLGFGTGDKFHFVGLVKRQGNLLLLFKCQY